MATKSPDAFRTISEVAEDLDLPQHVLRFWETRFTQIKPLKRGGGRRYYRPDDVDLLRGIRHLLYGEGYTIRGVQRLLKEQGARFVSGAGRGEFAGLPERMADGDGPEEETARFSVEGEEAEEIQRVADDVEVDRDDHSPDDDQEAAPGAIVRGARRLVGRLVDGPEPAPRPAGLSPADAERLQATLTDLLECKRLLDQAR